MTPSSRTEAALKRFSSALDLLEAALERRAEAAGISANLQEELAVMQDDRARLAAELDGALHRNHVLGLANDDVKGRLEQASAAIRDILAGNDSE